jgi:hypothetical protein
LAGTFALAAGLAAVLATGFAGFFLVFGIY